MPRREINVDRVTEQADGSFIQELEFPIAVAGETLETIAYKRPKAGHLRKAKGIKDDTERALKLLEQLSGWPQSAIDDLDLADMSVFGDVVVAISGE